VELLLYLCLIPLPRSCRRLHRRWHHDHSLERAPRCRVTFVVRGVNPQQFPPYRNRGQIRRAVNSKLVSATLRRRLPSRAIVPTRCPRGGGRVSPLVRLDLTVVMVIDETCSRWCVGDRNHSLWEANGCGEHYIRWGGPLSAGYPYRIRCHRSQPPLLALGLSCASAVASTLTSAPRRSTFFGPYHHLLGVRASG
jgi:hypothetical protein